MGSGIVKSKDWLFIGIMAGSFIANYVFQVNVIYIILVVAVLGVIRTLYREHRKVAKT